MLYSVLCMDQNQLKKIELFAKNAMLKSKDISHDWGHVERVRKNSLNIADYLNLDLDKHLLEASALLHDLSYSENRGNIFFKYFYEVRMTIELLQKAFKFELSFVSSQDQNIIIEAIKHHAFSFPYPRLNKKRSIFIQVLQDADTIDYFSKERFKQACQRKTLLITYKLLKFIYDFGFHNLKYFLNFPQLAGLGEWHIFPFLLESLGLQIWKSWCLFQVMLLQKNLSLFLKKRSQKNII